MNSRYHYYGALLLLFLTLLSTVVDAQTQGKTSSGPVGASMAILATLQGADVLPPEGTVEANRVIQVVIQLQAAFMKSSHSAVRELFDQALAAKWGADATERKSRFLRRGWTSEIVEALCEHYRSRTEEQRGHLAEGLMQFNMGLSEMELLCHLYEKARTSYIQTGRNIHEVFSEQRQKMPGAQHEYRKEQRDGNQGLYPYQS